MQASKWQGEGCLWHVPILSGAQVGVRSTARRTITQQRHHVSAAAAAAAAV